MHMHESEEDFLADIGARAAGARDHRFDMLIRSPKTQVILASLPPGGASNRQQSINRKSDQVIYLIEGEATAVMDDVEHELHEGNLLLVPAGQPQQITNTGSRRLLYLDFFAGDTSETTRKE
jgi:mannose-6-phosphate isomerase-like protein (cupin superfamily)